MIENNVHNKILQFAVPEITFTQFYDFLLDSNAGKPIWVKWNKVDGGQTTRSVYWGPFLNGIARGAIYDYEAYDDIAQSDFNRIATSLDPTKHKKSYNYVKKLEKLNRLKDYEVIN